MNGEYESMEMTTEQAKAFQSALMSLVMNGYANIEGEITGSDEVDIAIDSNGYYDFSLGFCDTWTFDKSCVNDGLEDLSMADSGILCSFFQGTYSLDNIKTDEFLEKIESTIRLIRL